MISKKLHVLIRVRGWSFIEKYSPYFTIEKEKMMLTNITLTNVASFDYEGAKLENLNEINYIYGNNGTGKTTISNYINDMDNTSFNNCSIKGNIPSKIFVYNQKYVEEVVVDKNIPGIFSLGEDAKKYENQLEVLEVKLKKNKSKKMNIENTLAEAEEEYEEINEDHKDYIWDMYRNHKESELSSVYNKTSIGPKNNKTVFFQEYLTYKAENENKIDLDEKSKLISDVDLVFDEKVTLEDEIKLIDDVMKPSTYIFKKPIIGTSEIDFGELVHSLKIDGWVADGKRIIEKNNLSECPLCQQKLADDISEKLAVCFDDKYYELLSDLEDSVKEYQHFYEQIKISVSKLKHHKFIDAQKVDLVIREIERVNAENEVIILEKRQNPSNVVNISLFESSISETNHMITEANISIKELNEKVNDKKTYKEHLKNQAKQYFVKEVGFESKRYEEKLNKCCKKIKGLQQALSNKNKFITEIESEISTIKTRIEGINFTAEDLNKQLRLFGFYNFSIKPIDNSYYQLIRENDMPVSNTLSEGEKTFISFLYFYHSITKDRNNDKLIVIDDPISSLDSSILYVVSSIVKKLIKEKDSLNITQVILSTHNTYFFKEISHRSDLNLTNYYILRKNKSITSIEKYENNPITSSYELLWKELYEYKNSPTSSVPNIMRRILEEYFTFLGDIKLDELILAFDPDEQVIADSLIKFSHDGSHRINEALYVEQTDQIYDKYYEIFEKIFMENKQGSHYDMMTKRYLEKV